MCAMEAMNKEKSIDYLLKSEGIFGLGVFKAQAQYFNITNLLRYVSFQAR